MKAEFMLGTGTAKGEVVKTNDATVIVKLPNGKKIKRHVICKPTNERIFKMRELNIGSKRFTKIIVTDAPGQGGACHEYIVIEQPQTSDLANQTMVEFAKVSFQNGPVKEFGVNGCHQEDLLAIVIDRLRSFQAGPFSCRENAIALTKLEEAMHWLNHRTSDRQSQGVEGTTQHRK